VILNCRSSVNLTLPSSFYKGQIANKFVNFSFSFRQLSFCLRSQNGRIVSSRCWLWKRTCLRCVCHWRCECLSSSDGRSQTVCRRVLNIIWLRYNKVRIVNVIYFIAPFEEGRGFSSAFFISNLRDLEILFELTRLKRFCSQSLNLTSLIIFNYNKCFFHIH
jgi:hypothetical protein